MTWMRRLFGLMVVSLLGCPGVVGNGHVVTQWRPAQSFTSITVQDGIRVNQVLGLPALSVRTDENLLDLVLTSVEGSTLLIRHRPGVVLYATVVEVGVTNDVMEGLRASGGSHVAAQATPTMSFGLSAEGGSEVSIVDMSSGQLFLDASGGSRVTANGMVSLLDLTASGGSHVEAAALFASRATLEVSGGSFAAVTVLERVDGDVSGGSRATIFGGPTSSVTTSGGSTVTFIGQ